MSQVYFQILLERAMLDVPTDTLFSVCMEAGRKGYTRLRATTADNIAVFARTDQARNNAVKSFLAISEDPDDQLVMLDADHRYPYNAIEWLTTTPAELGVVGALAFGRGEMPSPYFFYWDLETDRAETPVVFSEHGVLKCDFVSTSFMSIRRWVFDKLDAAGFVWPYFRYTYDRPMPLAEDSYFAETCIKAGISHHVNLDLVIPHIPANYHMVTRDDWERYSKEHKERFVEATNGRPWENGSNGNGAAAHPTGSNGSAGAQSQARPEVKTKHVRHGR